MLPGDLSRYMVGACAFAWTLQIQLPAASADPGEPAVSIQAARTLANRAADLIAVGRYVEAEELLGQAYGHYPAPTIALLHARALVHLSRLAAAAGAYQRATLAKLEPDSPDAFRRAVAQARIEADELRPRVPRLQLVVTERARLNPRVRLRVDGRIVPHSQLGRWMLVDPGTRVVSAQLDGDSSKQVVRMDEGQRTVVEVGEPAGRDALYSTLPWVSIGVGAAAIGTGIATGLMATSAHGRAREACPDERCVEGGSGADELRRFQTYRVVSTVGYVLGAAGLGVGGVLLLRRPAEGPQLRVDLEQRSAIVGWAGTL